MTEPTTFLLHRVVSELDAYADTVLRQDYGVTFATFNFLASASTLPGLDVTALARCAGMSKAAASKRLPALVRDGMLTASPDPHHGRRLRIDLTPRALALVEHATERLEREFAAMLASRPGLDESVLRVQLDGLAQALEALPAPTPTSGES